MALTYTVIDVAEDTARNLWQVTCQKPDGELHHHVFPKAALEWRAAEYGIEDPAEILDVVLHEPYAPTEPSPLPVSLLRPTARQEPPKPRVTLYTARSTAEAREAHRELIAAAKERVRVVPPAHGPDPLELIRARHGITPEGRRAKAEAVDIHRWKKQYGGLPLPTPPAPHEEAPRA